MVDVSKNVTIGQGPIVVLVTEDTTRVAQIQENAKPNIQVHVGIFKSGTRMR